MYSETALNKTPSIPNKACGLKSIYSNINNPYKLELILFQTLYLVLSESGRVNSLYNGLHIPIKKLTNSFSHTTHTV